MMNCEGITKGIEEIRPLMADFASDFNSGKLTGIIDKMKEIDTKVELLFDEVEPNQVTCRNRITKKLRLSYLGPIKDKRAVGKKMIDDVLSPVLVDTENEEIIKIRYGMGQIVDKRIEQINGFIDDKAVVYFVHEGVKFWSLVDRDGYLLNDSLTRLNAFKPHNTDTEFPLFLSYPQSVSTIGYLKEDFQFVTIGGIDGHLNLDSTFHEGKAWVPTNEGIKLFDSNLEEIYTLDVEYSDVGPFKNGVASFLKRQDGKTYVGLIDDKKKEILSYEVGDSEAIAEGNYFPDELGFYYFKKGDYYFYFNRDGQTIEGDFTFVYPFSKEGVARVVSGERYFYINRNGENAFGKYFKSCDDFSCGLASVEDEDGNHLVINEKGETVLQLDLGDYCNYFYDGIARIDKENGEKYFVDKYGRKIFTLSGNMVAKAAFEDGTVEIRYGTIDGKKSFYIDRKGKIVFSDKTIESIKAEIAEYQASRQRQQ